MRLTVLHADRSADGPRATDVDVVPGTTSATLRREVARLTGRAEWASSRCSLTADGVPVGADHPVGLSPLVPGAVLSVGSATPVPAERRAVTCARHLAVTGGPDAGTLLALVEGAHLTVGPGAPLDVRDDGWGSTRLQLRLRPRPRRGHTGAGHAPAARVEVRTNGAATLVRTARRRQTSRRVPRGRWRRWPLGAEVRVGLSILELRDPTPHLEVGPGSPPRRGALRGRGRDRSSGQLTGMLVSTAGTAITGLVLALAVHQPLLALTGLTGPVMWWANRRAGAPSPQETRTAPTTAPDVAALRVASALSSSDVDVRVDAPWDDGGSLAVVGPRGVVLAAARAIVVGELGSRGDCSVTVRGGRAEDWAWLVWAATTSQRWTASPVGDPSAGCRALVVVDGPDEGVDVARWRAHAPTAHKLLWIGRDAAAVPSWCRNVVVVSATGAQVHRAGHPPRTMRPVGVRQDVAEAHSRALARASAQVPDGRPELPDDRLPLARCPDVVAFDALPGVPSADVDAVAAAWSTPPAGLRTPVGVGSDGVPVVLDLVRDGPHAVVAGTTGSGKSELLTSLVLGLALRYPPDRLAVLLVDFKGGTGLPDLAALPHLVGRLSDLDAAGARRVLLGLGAELRRREQIVAAAGVRDVDELPRTSRDGGPGGLARLLVVIDEFRALADDLPELLPGLGRLAAQGRSLGVHLVLATQRPAGAVPVELRANLSLRVALRVVDAADSVDLVGVPDAARIGSQTPGRAVVVRGGGAAQAVQVARAGEVGEHGPVRLAPPATDRLSGGPGRPWTPPVRCTRDRPDRVHEWVSATRAAARSRPPADVPWLPELPALVHAEDLEPGPGIPVALADLPDQQRRSAVRWLPDRGHLLVLGGPSSGRTTALVAIGRQVMAAGHDLHAVGLPDAAARQLRASAPRRLGTVVPAADVVTVARLLDVLTHASTGGARPVLLLDGLDAVLEHLAPLARGAAAEMLRGFWARSDPPAVLLASAPVTPTSARLLGSFPDRLVLGVADPSLDTLAGVPSVLAGPRSLPGRAVHVGAAGAVLCQVALPTVVEAKPEDRDDARPEPPRLAPPPRTARRVPAPPRRGPDGRLHLAVGIGADGSGTVDVDVLDALLVVGPPGSGRTTVLSAVGETLTRCGAPTLRLPGDGPAAADELLALLDGPHPELVVLLDDLDDLERTDPRTAQALLDRLTVQRRRPGGVPALRVVATTTTGYAAASYTGLVPALLRARRLLALDVREPGSGDLLGTAARWLADPRPGPPGRGALRRESAVVPVQVWAPTGT